jgi:outer membrane autotransporter protein
VFFSGNIGRGEFDPTNLTPQYDFDVDGLTAGIDYRWSDNLVVGGAVGYTRQDTDLAGGQGQVETQGLSLSAYTTWYSPREWYVDGVLTFGWNSYDHERAIVYVLPGSVVNQTATADSDGTDFALSLTFGRDWAKRAWTYGVYGRAAFNRLQFDAFEEEVDSALNGNGLALGIDSRSVTGLSTTIGGKVSYAHSTSWGVLMPLAELEWLHDFRSDAEAFRGFFVDDPTQTPILVLGDDLDSDYFRVGLGLSLVLTQGRSGFVTYERLLGRSGISQEMLTLGFRMEF